MRLRGLPKGLDNGPFQLESFPGPVPHMSKRKGGYYETQ